MQTAFHSDYVDSTWNTAGVNDPVMDALIDGIIAAQEDEALLMAHGHAFDRVARWQFYVIPNWHSDIFRIAYWDRFGMPEVRPSLDLGVDTWWYEPERSARITR
jgi:microcin C transport system substrate-binding protein